MISIIVPFYNNAPYLGRCIESIINQTYDEWELILVNDGSTDSSEEVIRPYLVDGRINLYCKENGGVSSARNYGIKQSIGEFLLFVDGDDWLAEDTCKVLLNVMEAKSPCCVIFGFNQTHGHIWAPEYNKDYLSLNDLKDDFDYWLNTELLSSSVNKLYRKNLLDSLFPDNMSFGEDLVFSLNYLSKCERICFIKDPLYQHEVYNTSSITHTFNKMRLNDLELVQQSIMKFANKVSIDTNKKYFTDVMSSVKALFRQRNITSDEKKIILQKWEQNSYFYELELLDYTKRFSVVYLYAKMIKLRQWNVLSVLHCINNKIKDSL